MLINTELIGVLTKQPSYFLGIKEQAPKYAGLWIGRAERKLNTAIITVTRSVGARVNFLTLNKATIFSITFSVFCEGHKFLWFIA